jgi:hypothetical protein
MSFIKEIKNYMYFINWELYVSKYIKNVLDSN